MYDNSYICIVPNIISIDLLIAYRGYVCIHTYPLYKQNQIDAHRTPYCRRVDVHFSSVGTYSVL